MARVLLLLTIRALPWPTLVITASAHLLLVTSLLFKAQEASLLLPGSPALSTVAVALVAVPCLPTACAELPAPSQRRQLPPSAAAWVGTPQHHLLRVTRLRRQWWTCLDGLLHPPRSMLHHHPSHPPRLPLAEVSARPVPPTAPRHPPTLLPHPRLVTTTTLRRHQHSSTPQHLPVGHQRARRTALRHRTCMVQGLLPRRIRLLRLTTARRRRATPPPAPSLAVPRSLLRARSTLRLRLPTPPVAGLRATNSESSLFDA